MKKIHLHIHPASTIQPATSSHMKSYSLGSYRKTKKKNKINSTQTLSLFSSGSE